jgi:hypothetical protein
LQNRHKDKTALVIGNGPSLNDIPMDFLRKHTSFGTNRIYLLDGFTPTYYVAVDKVAIAASYDAIEKMECEKFIAGRFVWDGTVTDAHMLYSSVMPYFSRKPDECVYEGYSVTYVCLQLAFFMGFNTVLLVGVDHNYAEDSQNYFDTEYKNDVDGWCAPDLAQSGHAYKMAKTVFEHDGRRIVNLTPSTKLDVFEKGDIAEW